MLACLHNEDVYGGIIPIGFNEINDAGIDLMPVNSYCPVWKCVEVWNLAYSNQINEFRMVVEEFAWRSMGNTINL